MTLRETNPTLDHDALTLPPAEMIAEFSAFVPESHRREVLLLLRLALRYFADNTYFFRLANGSQLHDLTDWKQFFDQCVAALGQNPPSTEIQSRADLRPRPMVTQRQEQPRWDLTCPDCGHVHAGEKECGFPTGGERVCRCERRVRA